MRTQRVLPRIGPEFRVGLAMRTAAGSYSVWGKRCTERSEKRRRSSHGGGTTGKHRHHGIQHYCETRDISRKIERRQVFVSGHGKRVNAWSILDLRRHLCIRCCFVSLFIVESSLVSQTRIQANKGDNVTFDLRLGGELPPGVTRK